MCRVEDADRVELCTQSLRKARKPHVCHECTGPIYLGQTYEHATFLSDNRWQQHRTCQPCLTIRSWLERECNGWIWGQVIEELEEHWEERNWWEHGQPQPDESRLYESFLGCLVLLTRARVA